MRLPAKPSAVLAFVPTRVTGANNPRSRSVFNLNSWILVAVFALVLSSGMVSPVSPAGPVQYTRALVLTPLPSQLPTNSSGQSTFPALAVSITDLQGNILVASNDTVVYLSSSQTAVLSVSPTVTIRAGMQYALANISTMATPGSSVVTAVAPGFESASATFKTSIARGYPTQLRVYPLPGSFPAGMISSGTYVVAVVDAAGLPARTIQATDVQVTSSDTSVMTLSGASIPLNDAVGYGTISTPGKLGTAAITVSASGLVSDTALVTVSNVNGVANALSITSPAVSPPADGKTYNVLTVSLTNSSRPAVASSDVQVILTSSRTDIAVVPPSVVVRAGQSFVNVPITTTLASGSTIITASAPNFASSSAVVNTVSIPPTQLGVYLADDHGLISKTSNTLDMVVQLQDSAGIPAEARAPTSVIVSFSNSSLLQSPLTLTIPKGSDLVYTRVPLTVGTSGTFTAVSNGLASGSVSFSASALPISYSATAASLEIYSNQTTTVSFSIHYQGKPLSGVDLAWSSTGGTVSPAATVTDGTGISSTTFSPISTGVGIVTVTATSPLIGMINASSYITVTARPSSHPSGIVAMLLSFPYVLILVAAAAVAVVLVFLLIRRRRRASKEGAAIGEEEGAFSYLRPGTGLGLGAF
ncbi:MAG: Ig-like domain-containing protein [Thaumarchaeota archaeon]|nr:Ig-like domain-containing protein [Nitrososphaerota archaeon]